MQVCEKSWVYLKYFCGYSIDYNPQTISEEYSKTLQAIQRSYQYNSLIDLPELLRTDWMFSEYLNKAKILLEIKYVEQEKYRSNVNRYVDE